jgi:high-affinity iron transporter
MLPTFVIGLREGLEAALIIGIVAAFMRRNGRARDLWKMWLGVGIAVSLCTIAAIGLRIAEQRLPQKEQERLETLIGLIAVAFVTWMIVWMRNHAHEMKGEIETHAASALQSGSAGALIAMAFLAVLREGLETAVFLLALLNSSANTATTLTGALLGIALACGIGYGIYRGGVSINMARFFKLTGFVLVLVAAGLLANAAHTAWEGGWLHLGHSQLANLEWLVDKPNSVRAALLTGMFGLQPRPTRVEGVVWLAYAIPMSFFVLLPRKPKPKPAPERESKPALAV